MTAKQVILQRLRDAEHELTYGEYAGREGDVVSGIIQQHRSARRLNRNVMVKLGKVEATLPPSEQVPGEVYEHGTPAQGHVLQVHKGQRGPSITLSPHPPQPGQKLFALEVPEIADGIVEIVAIAREAGHRTKIAVRSQGGRAERQGRLHRPAGPARAQRGRTSCTARRSTSSTGHEDPARFVGNALSPATVISASRWSTPAAASARVVVPDYKLSLAIGKEGQNARLAARLTGWRIDIHSDTGDVDERWRRRRRRAAQSDEGP